MRLADFILANNETILVEWEAFARTCGPASGTMNIAALRDHAHEMLAVIAADLATDQNALAQSEKSKGRAPDTDPEPTAAGEHGAGRAHSGFTVDQMVAEYRALRASVIRLWATSADGLPPSVVIEDLTRFNEAIDQSLAESVARFNQDVEEAKETFLAILGHDLRTPIGAIHVSATFMLETGELVEPHRTLVERIAGSAKRAVTMVGDLLDFTRSRLGGGIPVDRAEVSLGKLVHDVIDELSAAHPDATIRADTRGDQRGRWDAGRLSQALSNIVGNAVQHGSADTPVTVEVRGEADRVTISVHNRGAVIPAEQLDGIFNPMKARRAPARPPSGGPVGSLGLGLYIAERIVSAHDGRIDVESSAGRGTTFTVSLPRGR